MYFLNWLSSNGFLLILPTFINDWLGLSHQTKYVNWSIKKPIQQSCSSVMLLQKLPIYYFSDKTWKLNSLVNVFYYFCYTL